MMIGVRGWLLVMVLCVFPASASASKTVNDWLTYSPVEKLIYVEGVIDSWADNKTMYESGLLKDYGNGEDKPSISEWLDHKLVDCMSAKHHMTYGQVTAIVQKYVDDNPTGWHRTMPSTVYAAMSEACKSLSQ